jgi:hypothetical protein
MENIPIKKAMFNSVLNDFSLLKLKANKCSILLAIVEGQMKKVRRKLKSLIKRLIVKVFSVLIVESLEEQFSLAYKEFEKEISLTIQNTSSSLSKSLGVLVLANSKIYIRKNISFMKILQKN